MEVRGTGIGSGIAIGRALRMPDRLPEPPDERSARTNTDESTRAQSALAGVARDLEERGRSAGGTARDVLEAQALMAQDPMLFQMIAERLESGKTAERAVFEAFASFAQQLTAIGGYLGERAADLDDVSQRVIASLMGVPAPGIPRSDEPFVLVAHDLSPADTAGLDLGTVLALVTSEGGPTSHTAILAREKSIAAVVGAREATRIGDGTLVIVDAARGKVLTDPSAADLEAARRRMEDRAAAAAAPLTPGRLSDGTSIPLLANLGSPDAIGDALDAGAEGVGLFRTEFLFLNAGDRAPTVEQQRDEYVKLLGAFPGKKVVVRVLDAGADKPLAFVNNGHEENPALGLRGLRALRESEDILRDQLTALAEADAVTEAELWVMAPMVSTVDETRYFVRLARELGVATAGVMVEVPSAALLADRVLAESDFASIGTNDLTQYTLAADRLLGSVAAYQDPWHPAVLRLIGEVGRAGETAGKPVGICGEAAADPLLAVVLVGLGATTLSMSPSGIADVRASLLRYSRQDARRLAELALAADGAEAARAAVMAAVGDGDSARVAISG